MTAYLLTLLLGFGAGLLLRPWVARQVAKVKGKL